MPYFGGIFFCFANMGGGGGGNYSHFGPFGPSLAVGHFLFSAFGSLAILYQAT